GRSFPPALGMQTRLTARGSEVFSRRCHLSRAMRLSARLANLIIHIPSTPHAPFRCSTSSHAALRLSSRYTLSIKLCHSPPFTPCSRASSMRSVHTEGSTQLHRARICPPRSSSRTARGCLSFVASFTHPPSCFPSLHARYGASSLLRKL